MVKLLLPVVLAFFFTGSSVPECVCVKDLHASAAKVKAGRQQLFDKATAVFEGKAISNDGYSVKFQLTKRWKGDEAGEVILSTGAVRGYDGTPLPEECSYQFQLGERYLIYAFGSTDHMKADSCSTFRMKDAAGEEMGLDQIKPHQSIGAKQN